MNGHRAVILAGGRGTRLAPYTTVIPKPLLPVGDRAILDVVMHQLQRTHFDEVTLAVGHLAHLVRAVFGDGSRHGVSIDYFEEEAPLGTVGALASIDRLDDPFLVMNGDLLTTLDYRAFYEWHVESGNVLSIATHARTLHADYGILRLGGSSHSDRVIGMHEKPSFPVIVSMGIYAFDPLAIDYIDIGERLDLPDLVARLLDANHPVGSYRHDGFWLDVGRPEDYAAAIEQFEELTPQLLSGNGAVHARS